MPRAYLAPPAKQVAAWASAGLANQSALGMVAMNAYREHVGSRRLDDGSAPLFNELPSRTQEHWRSVALEELGARAEQAS